MKLNKNMCNRHCVPNSKNFSGILSYDHDERLDFIIIVLYNILNIKVVTQH